MRGRGTVLKDLICRHCGAPFSVYVGTGDRALCERCRETLKWCSRCKRGQPFSEYHRDRSSRDGFNERCKTCSAEMARQRKKVPHNALADRDHKLRMRYGISAADWDEMARAQDGRCAICRKVPKHGLVVDHCHDSNRVRALLCAACNKGIGHFGDDLELVRAAAAYLADYASQRDDDAA